MARRVLENPKIKPLWFRVVDEVLGADLGVTGIRLKDPRSDQTEEIEIDGVFVAIGHRPNTAFLDGQLETGEGSYLTTKPGSTETSVKGVFAAGDVQDSKFRQAVTAAGTGCMAAIEASHFLKDES
jgi:thioredoxin reductase (NADPH)